MKTKKKACFFGILTAIVLSLSFITPATARTKVWEWKTAPFTDLANDVYQYLPGQSPWEGVKVNHQSGIDIVLVDVQGTDFIIVCSSPPLTGANYNYTIDIDNDADDVAEYIIFWSASGFVLQRYSDGQYWDGGNWVGSPSSFGTGGAGNNLSIGVSGDPIANLASARLSMTSTYTGNGTYLFLDYAPDPSAEAGWVLLLIILFPLVGAAIAGYIILKKRDVIFD